MLLYLCYSIKLNFEICLGYIPIKMSSDGKGFCQATSVIFLHDGTVATPSKEINVVTFSNSISTVPASAWHLDDPLDSNASYLARFGNVNVSSYTDPEGLTLKVTGKLQHFDGDGNDIDCAGQSAVMVVAGNSGKCSLVSAFVCHND